jgi:uncharacterized PurR-regulated membrane protein YhhQ (DUF165 family)
MKISIKRLGNLIATLVFGFLAFSTGQGTLQETIHFAGIANEIVFFAITSALTFIFGYLTVSK